MNLGTLTKIVLASKMIIGQNKKYNLSVIINILKTPPSQRDEKSLEILRYLTASIDFFKTNIIELGEYVHTQACQCLDYESCMKGEVLHI